MTTGRPTLLDAQSQTAITRAISVGATFEAASGAAGISYSTFNNWYNRGLAELERRQSQRVKEGSSQWVTEQPFVEFLEAVKKAKGERQIRWLAQIEKASTEGNWQAAAWKLERTEPENFGRQRIEITGADGGPVVVNWDEPKDSN